MPISSNLLALDIGGSRIGVALASFEARLPSPLKTLSNSQKVYAEIAELVEAEGIGALIIGYPRNLEGQNTQQTAMVESFVDELKKHINVEVIFQDEALTSVKAKEELNASGKPYQKGDVDALAATYILEDYLKENGG